MAIKNAFLGKTKYRFYALTMEEEYKIRRLLLTGLGGHECPPEEGDERQCEGMYPLYDTVRMAEAAMQELLKLKAKVAKFQAAEAERYHIRYAEED